MVPSSGTLMPSLHTCRIVQENARTWDTQEFRDAEHDELSKRHASYIKSSRSDADSNLEPCKRCHMRSRGDSSKHDKVVNAVPSGDRASGASFKDVDVVSLYNHEDRRGTSDTQAFAKDCRRSNSWPSNRNAKHMINTICCQACERARGSQRWQGKR